MFIAVLDFKVINQIQIENDVYLYAVYINLYFFKLNFNSFNQFITFLGLWSCEISLFHKLIYTIYSVLFTSTQNRRTRSFSSIYTQQKISDTICIFAGFF